MQGRRVHIDELGSRLGRQDSQGGKKDRHLFIYLLGIRYHPLAILNLN